MRSLRFAFMVTAVACAIALVQADEGADRARAAASLAPDLRFPAKPSSVGYFATPEMALYKPEGAGPFPALIVHHQCGGLANGPWQNMAILEWARRAVASGYVVLVIDSLSPRGVRSVCQQAAGGVNFPRGVKDAFQAAAHLATLAYVDRARIAHVGFSWGGMVGLLAASRRWSEALAGDGRIAAFVAFYPGCFTIRPQNGRDYEILNTDIGQPLLVLTGERDTETPAADCVSRLESAKQAGASAQWRVFPGATHCWDCENLNGHTKMSVAGEPVRYAYDRVVTEESARRLFDFLSEALPAPR